MAANRRLLILASLIVVVLGAAAYLYLDKKKASVPPDANSLLAALPSDTSANASIAVTEWTQEAAIGRYDTMHRLGTRITGSWASGIQEACMGSAPVTSVPDEKSWKQPIVVHQCFDGVPVFRIELEQ
jgi:hypothetical protein